MGRRHARTGRATTIKPSRRAGRCAFVAAASVASALAASVAGCTVARQPAPGLSTPVLSSPPTDATASLQGDAPISDAAAPSTQSAPSRPRPSAAPTRERVTLFDPLDTPVTLESVATGLDEPVFATGDGVDPSWLLVVEKAGAIERVDLADGTVSAVPFVDLTDRVNSGASERGLLSVAFHPDYAVNGRLFVNYTRRDGATVISELAADADRTRADPASERELLVIDQPAANHNGGQNAFGPDGYLYVGMGDGGGSGAGKNAQDPATLLGKILRLDVDGPPGSYAVPSDNPFVGGDGAAAFRPEVWAYGLRNPWRLSFDRATGDLYVADVGDSTWEEVNRQPAGGRGGENYGWPDLEGDHCRGADEADDLAACDPDGRTTRPVTEYRHEDGNCAVSGGFVYRGARAPALDGVYLYGDYCSGRLWGAWRGPGGAWRDALLADTEHTISGFGQDDRGEVYVLDMAGGEVLRVDAGGA